ncbi:hypothetical protein [Floridanema aerugineum]|jgi:hypothetical protein|uniref:Peptidase C-terminal archaeal/bacterial domain-containing protein n=1 Tax=Floridaenema aerugineum BLCC-F46 TaxID=3153654 RepID=A0ABV4X8P1_9CYAN
MSLVRAVHLAVLIGGLAYTNISPALAATRIQFARGSYCGVYSGNFSSGREFVLHLRKGQNFTSRNTGSGTQYDVYVRGPGGRVPGTKVSPSQIDYAIPVTGNYYIYVESTTNYNSIEFCAY